MSRYNVHRLITIAGFSLLSVAACAQTNWSGQRRNYRAPQANSDRMFARTLAQGNLSEIRLGRLAVRRAQSEEVRAFAQMMINDHRAALLDLRRLAAEHNINLPTDVSPDHAATYDRLSSLRGEAFDRVYMNVMVREHAKTVRTVEAKANSRDTDFQDWAAEKLETIRHHLAEAREIRSQMSADRR